MNPSTNADHLEVGYFLFKDYSDGTRYRKKFKCLPDDRVEITIYNMHDGLWVETARNNLHRKDAVKNWDICTKELGWIR